MKQFLGLVWFQLRQYVKNTYFINLVLIQTSVMVLYQNLANYQHYSGKEWLVAGVLGMWASCTSSAGALGFQRWQGTLAYLLNSVVPTYKVLLATLAPAALYGLVSFPLAAIECLILGMPVRFISLQLFGGIFLFWLAATLLSYMISLIFILSSHAIEYEELLLLPILLLSGMLTIPNNILVYIRPWQMISPFTLPMKMIYQEPINGIWIIAFLIVIIVCLIISWHVTKIVLRKALKENSLEIF